VDVDGRRSALFTPFAGCLSVYRRSSQTLQSGTTYQKETCISPHMPPYVVVWIHFGSCISKPLDLSCPGLFGDIEESIRQMQLATLMAPVL
jgi:hypothetical protein